MVNDRNVEQLLLQANPVLDPEELRLTASEVDARCASILERRGVMQTQTPTRMPAGTPAPRRWRKPALAFMISLLVILIAAGGVALLVGGSGPEVADETPVTTATTTPTTTTPTTTATTVPGALPDGVISAPAYAAVPSFSGVVEYYEHDPALGDPGWQATVAIKHAGPMLYEAEVLSGGPPYLGQVGAVFLGDGSATWLSEAQGEPLWVASDFDHFNHVYFDSGSHRPWSEICAEGSVLGTETLLGRTTTHVACSTDLEDYELWVHEETGIVMKLIGPLGIGDLSPYADRDGGFVFTDLAFGPVTITEAPTPPAPITSEFPPFHMVQEGTTDIFELWYLDNYTGRQTVIASEDPSQVDGFYLMADEYVGGCSNEGCEKVALEDAYGEDFTVLMRLIPLSIVEENCTELAEGTVAGRPARHFACAGVVFDWPGYWRVVEVEGASNELWFDTETSVLVKDATPAIAWEATSFETNPEFPPGIFDWPEFEPDQPTGLQIGDIAPLWSGPLLGGGGFDLADYRGGHVVVYNWLVGYGSSNLDGLDLMQRMYDKYGEDITFVTVHEDSASETSRVLERRGNTVPAVYCVAASGTDHDPACATPELGPHWDASPWFLWGNPIASTTVLDEAGTVLLVRAGAIEYESELDALLAQIAAGAP